MPQAFVHLTPELDRACRQDVVLTTTERLRRNLALAYDEARLAEGRAAWATPQIWTFDGYLAELHSRARLDAGVPALLSAEAEFELFRTTAPEGLERLIPLAREAWRLCRHWQIELTGANLAATEQGRLFLDWAERIQRRLDGDHAVTRADLPVLGPLQARASRLCCVAFEHTPRAYEAWLERARAAGAEVTHLAGPAIPNQTTERISFDTAATELAAIAGWARETLLESPDARIGVVVPDLSRRHQAVVRQFTAELDPLLEAGTDGLVDVGGGIPLAEQPVWRAAAQWLTLCFHRLPLDAARRCVNSSYLDLPRVPQLPDRGPPLVDLTELARLVGAPRLAELARRRTDTAPKVLGDWLKEFLATLDLAGWPGQNLGSVQYQAQADARARVERLAAGRGGRRLSPTAALDVLQQYLSSAIFAPERSPASIQIMGYLETTGLAFTHLWVSGLDDQCWPQPLTLNPFIPAATQRRLGLPRATPTLETAFAADRLAHWRASAAHLIVSHARNAGEARLRPSPLIGAFREVSRPGLAGHRPHPAFVHGHGQLEVVDDPCGLPSPGGAQRGGTSRIRDQALCPFRGYAIHRLLLKEPRAAHGLPDPLDRGLAIHDALQRLYTTAAEESKTPTDLTLADFERAVDGSLERNFARFPESFRLRERDRLTVLLDAWNRLECEGISDGIEALEATRDVAFGDLGLTLRVDRIDRLGEAWIVIDYKTGRIGNRLDRERLVEPQLPLYALTNDRIRGVLYAEIDEVRPRLQGISELPIASATVKPPAGGSWSAQINSWRKKLDVLIEEIGAGYAAVAPFDASACQNCHLGGFCRVTDGASQ